MCTRSQGVHTMTLLAVVVVSTLPVGHDALRRNFDARQTSSISINANIPLWKQRVSSQTSPTPPLTPDSFPLDSAPRSQACEKPQKYKMNSHYTCDEKGDVKCLPGWQGDLCQVPMCRRGCDPMNGYCQRPGECRCRIGYTGEQCDKCIPLPGCQHGICNKPFECICKPGWDGLFCTERKSRFRIHGSKILSMTVCFCFLLLQPAAARAATAHEATARPLASVAAALAGRDAAAASAPRCQAASTAHATSRWSATACLGIRGCCARQVSRGSVPPAIPRPTALSLTSASTISCISCSSSFFYTCYSYSFSSFFFFPFFSHSSPLAASPAFVPLLPQCGSSSTDPLSRSIYLAALCASDCSKQHGYCRKPGECR